MVPLNHVFLRSLFCLYLNGSLLFHFFDEMIMSVSVTENQVQSVWKPETFNGRRGAVEFRQKSEREPLMKKINCLHNYKKYQKT